MTTCDHCHQKFEGPSEDYFYNVKGRAICEDCYNNYYREDHFKSDVKDYENYLRWITIKWSVVSKMTGIVVEEGKRQLQLISKSSTAKDHVRQTQTFLQTVWARCAYDIHVAWIPGKV